MRETFRNIFWGPVVIYPVLFVIFPILFVYAHNIREMAAGQIVIPLVVSVLFTFLLWAILSLILRSMSKAGLATTIFLFLFFSYGRFYELLERWDVFVPGHGHLLPAVLLIFGYCVYFIKLARRDFKLTTKILNLMAVALIAINLFNIGSYEVKVARLSAGATPESPEPTAAAASPAELSTLPDIYYIILDEYAHPDTMKEWYNYDNSQFIKSLEDKGFFVAQKSRTRTPNSHEVLAQVLNMEYLSEGYYWDESTKKFRENTSAQVKDFSDKAWMHMVFQKIVDNKVTDFLKSKGYKYVYFGSWFALDSWEPGMKDNADLYFNYYKVTGSGWGAEFHYILWNTTMMRPFYQHLAGGQYETYYRRGVLGTLGHLKKVPDIEGPKFVLAYFMSPHSPYVFGAKGDHIATPNYSNFKDKQFYRGQYIFISTEIEKVVDVLLKKSKSPPIIILKSDHGQRPHHPGIVIGSEEWKKILNAMYLPGMDNAVLYESISPVNTFRLIFNHYFGADYPLLEDD